MIATIRTWNGFHSGDNITKISYVCHMLHFVRYTIFMMDCYASVVGIYKKICIIIKCVLHSNSNFSVEKQNPR